MDLTALRQEMDAIHWLHTMPLGELGMTKGYFTLEQEAAQAAYMHIPEDLRGKRVLDVGAWDGLWSFEAERRGASLVVALDTWDGKGSQVGGRLLPKPTREGFDFAKRVLGSRVYPIQGTVSNLCYELESPLPCLEAIVFDTKFDVVLFLGVLYHLRHPLWALERIRSVMADDGLLILETHVDLLSVPRPAVAFYEGAEAGEDPTNWWGPNTAA
ncbi:MAG TPA: methyltransferase domain-containing protein, partial [Streptosporangiaceae bacterium]